MHAISIVTPAYNDERTVLPVLSQLEKLLKRSGRIYEIVIVDDKSTDNTVKLLKWYRNRHRNVRVYYHPKNLGIAKTYRELYQRARYPIVVLFSLDGEWAPVDCLRLVRKLEEGNYTMVIGWRRKKAYRWGRIVVSFFYNNLVRLLFGVPSYDAGSIKAIEKNLLASIPIQSRGVFDEAERIIRSYRAGYRIGVLPVRHRAIVHKRRFFTRINLLIEAIGDMLSVMKNIYSG